MKKACLTILIILFVSLCCSGCSLIEVANAGENNEEFTKIFYNGNTGFGVWQDNETGIQYLFTYEGYITPRLNSDGSIYVAK